MFFTRFATRLELIEFGLIIGSLSGFLCRNDFRRWDRIGGLCLAQFVIAEVQ